MLSENARGINENRQLRVKHQKEAICKCNLKLALACLTCISASYHFCSATCLGFSAFSRIFSLSSKRCTLSGVRDTGAGEKKIAYRPKSHKKPTPNTFGFL